MMIFEWNNISDRTLRNWDKILCGKNVCEDVFVFIFNYKYFNYIDLNNIILY